MKSHNQTRHFLIVGAGGFGREVAWLARDIHGADTRLTFAVEPRYLSEEIVDDIRVVALNKLSADVSHYVIAVGNAVERRRLSAQCDAAGLVPATLIHPSVLRSARVDFGLGSILCAGSIITTNVRIGRHVHLNLGCTIGHDVVIGDFATISPGVHLSGNVRVEDGAFLGTGVNVINGVTGHPLVIGRDAVVAAGACVTRPVEPGTLVAGVPAIRKR